MLENNSISWWAWGTIAFLAELVALAGAGVVGYRLTDSAPTLVRWLIAILSSSLVITVWALWFSPKSDYRLPDWPRAIGAAVIMWGVAAGLRVTGLNVSAIVLAVLGIFGGLIAQLTLENL